MTQGFIFDIKKFSIHDGPGIRTTVFLKGCPLHCQWCHNPESQLPGAELVLRGERCIRCGACVDVCPAGAISLNGNLPLTDRSVCTRCGVCVEVCYADARELVGREITVDQMMLEIERDVAFYDESGGGVTFSGGEPLAQPAFLLVLLQACRAREIHTAVDTCGYSAWQVFDRIRPHTALFLYDLKLMDDARHRAFTGVSNTLILDNLRRLSQLGHDIIVRMPIIPRVNDDLENLQQTAAFAASLPHLRRLDILPYHRAGADKYTRGDKVYALPELAPPSPARMAEIAQILQGSHLQVKIGG